MISCICVTRNRPLQLERVINCFRSQTYIKKELVIVCENDDKGTIDYLNNVNDKNILKIVINIEPKKTLGELRNIGIKKCNGTFFCQWDDDDWYHYQRLEKQMKILEKNNKKACVLSQWIIYDIQEQNCYISSRRAWEGSLLCNKKYFIEKIKYDNLEKGEDTPAINKLLKHNELTIIDNVPYLYIYQYHGNNTWNRKHFESLIKHSTKCNKKYSKIIYNILEKNIYSRLTSKIISYYYKKI